MNCIITCGMEASGPRACGAGVLPGGSAGSLSSAEESNTYLLGFGGLGAGLV